MDNTHNQAGRNQPGQNVASLDSDERDRAWELCDLRRPTKLSREQIRSLDLFHDTFSRKLSSGLGRLARSAASLEITRTSQLTWDEYIRTLPTVTTLISASAAPLAGDVLIEMDTSVSLAIGSRLLGGSGKLEPPRRPGELELPTIRRIGAVAVEALGDALSQFVDVQSTLEAIDLSPQLVGLAAPSQVVLVLGYVLTVPGCNLSGDLSVVMSLSTLAPMLEQIMSHAAERGGAETDPGVMRQLAEQVPITLEATLARTVMPAGAVAGLAVGDVVVLDHRVGQPATVSVGDMKILRGHLGRRGSRLAIAVSEHPFETATTHNMVHNGPAAAAGQQGHSQTAYDVSSFNQDARQHDARDSDTSPRPVHSVR